MVFTNAAFKNREVFYMASNNIKSVGKSTGVKVSPILFAKVSVLVSAILSAHSIGIGIGDTFCKYRQQAWSRHISVRCRLEMCSYCTERTTSPFECPDCRRILQQN